MSIALSLGNNLTTGGIFKPTAVNNTSVNNVTDFAGIAGGGTLVLLSTQTASSSASLSFTTGIDSTYKEYVFKFINIHPSTRNADFQFNMSIDAGSNYNVTKTTTAFRAFHEESGGSSSLAYQTGDDLAQSTSYQDLSIGGGIQEEDEDSLSGYLHLFEPSSTTFVKHFISVTNQINAGNNAMNGYIAGYGNTTSAVDAVDFKMSSGNIDSGVIKMYGVAKS
tara:strand:+ start:206 stop:871 length:666 start_codon:yes stop_codon:yes gene_type:complete